jgi:ACT domain-containing protein
VEIIHQQQRKAAQSLIVLSSLTSNEKISQQITEITKKMGLIRDSADNAEETFKNVVQQIGRTTTTLLIELPSLITFLQNGELCEATSKLWVLIEMINGLLNDLERSTIPISALKTDVSELVEALQRLKATSKVEQMEIEAEKSANSDKWFPDSTKDRYLAVSGNIRGCVWCGNDIVEFS